MRRRAVIAGCCLALGLSPGCAAARLRRDRAAETPEAVSIRRDLRQAASAAMDRGDHAQARADLEQLIGQSPRSAELHYLLGKVLQSQGELPPAEASYRRALAIEPQYVGALIGLGQVAARLGRPAEALGRFDTAIEFDPHQAEAQFARGEVLETLGRADDALAAYFHALDIDPASAPAMIRVAALQLDRGKPDQALVRLDQAVELSPGDEPEIRYRRGLAYLAMHRPEDAARDLEFAAGRLPDRAEVFLSLAQAMDACRKPDEARRAFARALTLRPDLRVAPDLSERLRR